MKTGEVKVEEEVRLDELRIDEVKVIKGGIMDKWEDVMKLNDKGNELNEELKKEVQFLLEKCNIEISLETIEELLNRLIINGHQIANLKEEIGIGLYPSGAIINHHCQVLYSSSLLSISL